MIEFAETIDCPSTVLPGVVFRVKRINHLERIASDATIAEALIEHDDADDEIAFLLTQPSTKETRKEIRTLRHRVNDLYSGTIVPHRIRVGFVAVFGLVDELKRPIAELDRVLRLSNTKALVELYGFCRDAAELPSEQLGNLQSPGTSSEPATPAATNTTAGSVNGSDSTNLAIVPGIFPTKSIAA